MRAWGIIAGLALSLTGCRPATPPLHPDGDTNPQRQLARSLGIIRTATPAHPKTLKILFYGQSITQTKWTDIAAAHLRQTYPGTKFIVRNMAIGGFESVHLERTLDRDIGEFYPDLIVFHVFGDHRAYERIVRGIRSRTAAELILQTDHVTGPPEPICASGIHLTLHAPPGCKGFLYYQQRSWEERNSSTLIPGVARRYDAAVDPRRWAWIAHLRRHNLAFETLLADPPHPNAQGWALMARLFDTWFDGLVRNWTPHPQHLVEDRALPADSETITATGNRFELIASAPLNGKVEVLVDGKAPRQIDGCWQTSRTNYLANVPYWPAISQVTVAPDVHRAMRWTAILTDFSADQTKFTFHLYNSLTDADGEGNSMTSFQSPSGQVRIDPKDWNVGMALGVSHKPLSAPYKISWDRHFACGDETPVQLTPDRIEVRHVIATGLTNAPHRITIRARPDARAAIASLRVYRPPLTD